MSDIIKAIKIIQEMQELNVCLCDYCHCEEVCKKIIESESEIFNISKPLLFCSQHTLPINRIKNCESCLYSKLADEKLYCHYNLLKAYMTKKNEKCEKWHEKETKQ